VDRHRKWLKQQAVVGKFPENILVIIVQMKVVNLKLLQDQKKRKRTATKSPKVSALSKLSEDQLTELNSLSISDLKARLKLNQQLQSGTKKELCNRVADCAVNGSLPKCPKCGGGRLKASGSGYKCPGFMEDTTFINCDYYSTAISRPPWNKLDGHQI